MDDLGRREQPKNGIPVGPVGDISREQPDRLRQVERPALCVYLGMQDVHGCNVIPGIDQTVRQSGSDESGTARN
jgi:hypothetical protein